VRIFGLTGGIASGKSTVARMLVERGVPMVDADVLAREAVLPGTPAARAIRETFGPGVFGPDGALDRKALGALVFADASLRARLNAIVHPAVSELARQRFAEHAARGATLIGYEVPLLFENGLDALFQPAVLVAVDEATQVSRLMARDGSTEEEARQRIGAQWPLAKKLERAKVVLWNDGTSVELATKVDALIAELRAPG
jgi:dephospho-CoA kinase